MKGQLNKKGQAFDLINKGMISFVVFVMICVLVILLISTTKQTNLVCDTNYYNGLCYDCNNATYPYFNSSDQACYNATTASLSSIASTEGGTAAYNATKDYTEAAMLPPQFAQIIVIVIVIVGILAMLAFVGYSAYQRMRR